ncbi:MFS transporter [Rhodoferax sp. GW822-FHT02A01]|uniref:MFS transporter n=1 Tax=Rhodoferax sp. GW822-FHT02A01 TaxID=3141537 RepID=UPI00315CC48E
MEITAQDGGMTVDRSLMWRLGVDMPQHRRVFACFFLYSFCMGGFFPRLAEIQHAMGVGEGPFGLALIGVAAGTLISLTFGANVIERLGHRRTLLWLLPCLPIFYVLASLATSPLIMFCCLFPAGLLIGSVEVVVNLEADRAEHQSGRRLMNRSHAFWSIGFFTAAALGALMAYLGVTPLQHLSGVVVLALLGTALLLGKFEAAPLREADHNHAQAEPQRFALPTAAILVLVVVTLPAMVLEGAGFDWSAIYMRNVFGTNAFWGGVAVATGAAAQALTRYFADGFVERHSPVTVARILVSVLAVGDVLVFVSPVPWLSLLGFALLGVGSSAIFPLAMSAAAQRTDRPSTVNVASLAQTAFVIFLLAPPLLGYVAQSFGIRWSFGIALPLVVASLWLSRAMGASGVRRS